MNETTDAKPGGRRSGRWITTLEGYRAFHPDPLPPVLNWSPQLASALADASLLIGRLAGEGRRLLNPHILIRPFIRREAVLSMLDLLGANPFVTPCGAEEKLGLAYNTVMRAVRLLQEQGIVAAVTEARRGRVFCANALLDILEEPARLTPVEPPSLKAAGMRSPA